VGEIMLERMTRMHRTLQQKFMGAMLDVVYDYSKLENGYVDARNEGSREIAQHMIAGIQSAEKYMFPADYKPEDPGYRRPQLPLI